MTYATQQDFSGRARCLLQVVMETNGTQVSPFGMQNKVYLTLFDDQYLGSPFHLCHSGVQLLGCHGSACVCSALKSVLPLLK
jgi:hypothetical protein